MAQIGVTPGYSPINLASLPTGWLDNASNRWGSGGWSSQPALVTPDGTGSAVAPTNAAATAYNSKAFGQPVAVWLGLIVTLILLHVLTEYHNVLGSVNPANVRIGGYNFLAVGVIAVTFTFGFKLLFASSKIPTLSNFAQAV